MKVLFVTGLTGFGIGGARTEEIRLVRGAADKGCDVAMCSDVLAGELAGIRHFKLDYPPGDKAPAQLAAALTEFKPEIVHVVGGGVRFLSDCNRAMMPAAASEKASAPWVFTAHNVPPAERIFPRLYGNTALHYAVRDTLAIPNVWSWSRYLKTSSFRTAICHSQTVARRLAKVGCPTKKIHEIPFGSELPDIAFQADANHPSVFPAGSSPRILTIAGLAFHKGQLDGIHAIARLRADFPNLSYRLIGMTRDKKYRAYLEKTIRDLDLSDNVRLIHSAPEALKFAALREADLYIQPSHEEGFCIAFLEAAMMVPMLIGADTGAIAAMGQNDPGTRIVAPGDVSALTRAAKELITGQATNATSVADRREALIRRYSWDAYLTAHLQAYASVLP